MTQYTRESKTHRKGTETFLTNAHQPYGKAGTGQNKLRRFYRLKVARKNACLLKIAIVLMNKHAILLTSHLTPPTHISSAFCRLYSQIPFSTPSKDRGLPISARFIFLPYPHSPHKGEQKSSPKTLNSAVSHCQIHLLRLLNHLKSAVRTINYSLW